MADDNMFQDAVDSLRRGDKARAKDLLTRLLKTDQNNATYWVWMSTVVDSAKERIYCLQTAHKLDPENASAKRGLILLGALLPDETVQPFQINRPRAWEQKLLLAHEQPKQKGVKAITSNPAARLAGVVVLGVAVCAVAVFGLLTRRAATVRLANTNTPGPSPTFTGTPTFINATGQPTSTFNGPTPLWMLLPATYTPTPLYVNTPRAPQSSDQYRAAKSAYAKGDWDTFISDMNLISTLEPDAPDIYYLIGEGYRFKGNASEALSNYNHALQIDPNFGAAYLGLARARLIQNSNANVDELFNLAIQRDPNFGEIYLERARYHLLHRDNEAALTDLDQANKLMPDSPEVYLTYASAYVALKDTTKAVQAAEKANQLDKTSLPSYLLLGELYISDGQYSKAIEPLATYIPYKPEDSKAFALIGQAYFELKNYDAAIENLDKAFKLNPSGLRTFSVYRGLSHLELGHADQAVADLERAYGVDETSFDVNLGLARGYYLQEKFGSAFLKVTETKSYAKTDEQIALVHYWRALIQEKREDLKDAYQEWKALLAMPENVMTPGMRADAEKHLKSIVTPTNTPKAGSKTATPTKPGGSATVTSTPKPGTVTPTRKSGGTVTPTPTRTPTP